MRHTLQRKRAACEGQRKPDPRKIRDLRLPKDFLFLLMDKLVNDLAANPTASGDAPILAHPDIDLSGVKEAIRKRSITAMLKATSPFDAQSISSRWSSEPAKAFGLYQIHTLLKKYPISGDSCRKAAYRTFLGYEHHCSLFNQENWKAIVSLNEYHPDYLGIIEDIRADIQRCIGAEPPIQSVYDNAKHGPGTALGLTPPMVTSYFKWSSLPYSVSPKALPYAREMIMQDPRWVRALVDRYELLQLDVNNVTHMEFLMALVLKETDHCKYGTVPKSALTDRSIGIEPTLNVMLQLGVDGVIRRRLKTRWGIDLNTQKLNQVLAAKSSITNEDATIDLKGASDCVAIMACLILLPVAWFELLMNLRSENIRVAKEFTEGKVEETFALSKISAMGNGFTFVLESLIFASICRVVMRRRKIKGNLAVYGDDLIVPVAAAPYVIDLLKLFGFDVNVDKTFTHGPFRESCGVDCLNGTNIRPLFLKHEVTSVTDIWYLLNSLFVLERSLPWYWEISFQETREWLYKFIPQMYRGVKGPPSESMDTYLFKENVRYDRYGCHKHWAICPRAVDVSDRAPGWYFRILMASLRASSVEMDTQDGFKFRSEWLARAHAATSTGSAFDVTLRGIIQPSLITRSAWRSSRVDLQSARMLV